MIPSLFADAAMGGDVANKAPSPEREACRLEWQPVGTGSRARIMAVGADTGSVGDIDTIDLARAADRSAYARRAAGRFGRWTVDAVEAELLRIAAERLEPDAKPEPTITLATAIDEWRQHETTPAVCTGFQPLDALAAGELTGGLPLGTITILLGMPGTGKSALALQAAVGALIGDPELRAVWGAGEMSITALAARAITVGSVLSGAASPVTTSQAKRRRPEAQRVADELRADIGERLVIVPPTLTVARLEEAVAASGARLLVVDYLQLCRHATAVDSRAEAEAALAGLRGLALVHGCAVILISSMSKGGERSIGSLVRNSGQGDFDADLLLLGEADEQEQSGLVPVRWRCMKHRHGTRRDLITLFDGDRQLFTDAAAPEPFEEFLDHAPQGARR